MQLASSAALNSASASRVPVRCSTRPVAGTARLQPMRRRTAPTAAAQGGGGFGGVEQPEPWPQQSYAPSPSLQTSRMRVRSLLDSGVNLYTQGPMALEFSTAVEQLILDAPATDLSSPGLLESMAGTWQVVWAPHIANMSGLLLGQFDPIIYKFGFNGSLTSNVKYNSSLLGASWLSASGSMTRKYDNAVEIHFDKFWVDMGGDRLRPELLTNLGAGDPTQGAGGPAFDVDSMIGAMGRAAFFPQLAIFPVHYIDPEFAVFEFTPLRSKIAIVRTTPQY